MTRKLLFLWAMLLSLFTSVNAQNYPTDWESDAPAAGDFYIYSPTHKVFLKKTSEVDAKPANATMFTLSASSGCTIAYDDNGTTKYVYESAGNASWGDTYTNKWTIASNNGGYYISHTDPANRTRTRYINYNGSSIDYPRNNFTNNNRTWIFISANKVDMTQQFTYSATVNAVAGTGGTANGGNANSEITHYKSKDLKVTVTATPSNGYIFKGWSETKGGAIVSTSKTYEVPVTCTNTNTSVTKTMYANFEEVSCMISPATGTLTNGDKTSNEYDAYWTSNQTNPVVKLQNDEKKNNIGNSSGSYLDLHTGDGPNIFNRYNTTYTLSVEGDDYEIVGYGFTMRYQNGNAMTVTKSDGTTVKGDKVSTNTYEVKETGLSGKSVTFTMKGDGANSAITAEDFYVMYKHVGTTVSSRVEIIENSRRSLFTNYAEQGGYYRIPAITKLSNGKLLALTDNRMTGNGDIGTGTHIQIVEKLGDIDADGQSTWGNESTAVHYSNVSSGFDYAHGDAAIITDRNSGESLVLAASGSTGYGSGGCQVGQYRSTDGVNWTSDGEITSKIKAQLPSGVTRQFFTSGRIIQSSKIKVGSHYRIYSAMCTNSGSVVMYSDDFGQNWYCLGNQVAYSGGDETVLEELPNGDLLLSARLSSDGRGFTIYKYNSGYGSGTWQSGITASSLSGVANCNGEMLLIPTNYTNKYVLIHSLAMSGRKNVTVFYKVIDANKTDYLSPSFYSDWKKGVQISDKASCYSTMVLDEYGNVAMLFEEAGSINTSGVYDINFISLTVNYEETSTYTVQFNGVPSGYSPTVKIKDAETGEWLPFDETKEYDYLTEDDIKATDIEGYWYKVKVTDEREIIVTYYENILPQTGKAYVIKARLTNGSTVTEFLFKSDRQTDGTLALHIVPKAEAENDPDWGDPYYWVLSEGPNYTGRTLNTEKGEPETYMYLSAYRGDGYLGNGNGLDYSKKDSNGNPTVVEGAGVACTTDYTKEFRIIDFHKGVADGTVAMHFWSDALSQTSAKVDDQTLNYSRLLAISSEGTPNWYNKKSSYDKPSSNNLYWTTDLVFVPVEHNEEAGYHGTIDEPLDHGFKCKFYRSDDGKAPDGDYSYYSILKTPFALKVPEEVDVYIAAPFTGYNEVINLVEYTSNNFKKNRVLPRETAVLMRIPKDKVGVLAEKNYLAVGETDVNTTLTFYFEPSVEKDIYFGNEQNVLYGVLGKTVFNDGDKVAEGVVFKKEDCWVLGKLNGKVAMYKTASNAIPANKGFVLCHVEDANNSTRGLAFRFPDEDGETTGIKEINHNVSNVIYDLTGRKVTKPVHGIYIINGKKIFVK